MEGKSGMALIDLSGMIFSANEGILSILSFSTEELVGKSIYDLLEVNYEQEVRSWLEQVAGPRKEGSPQARFSLSLRAKSKDYIKIFCFAKAIELNGKRFAMLILECQK
jgi:PAS domain S-box-containing protein